MAIPDVVMPARRGLRMAVALGGLSQAVAVALLGSAGVDTWRLVCLGGVFVGFAVIEHAFVAAVEDGHRIEAACVRMIAVAQLTQIACMALTGGVASPYLVSAILPAIMPWIVLGSVPQSRAIVVLSILLVTALALLPDAVTGPMLPRATFVAVAVAGYASALIVVDDSIRRIANAARRAEMTIESLRLRRLVGAEKRTRTLQCFRESIEDELRNPLAVVKALAQLVARDPRCDRTEERIAVLRGEVARIEQTINDHLSFGRTSESLELEDVDVATIAAEAAETLAPRAKAHAVTLDLALRPARAWVDVDRLTDVLLEVLSRAIASALPQGTVMIATFPAEEAAVIKIRIANARREAPHPVRFDGTYAALVVLQHGGELVCAPESERSLAITITLRERPATPAQLHQQLE